MFYDKLDQWTKQNQECLLSSKQFSPISIAISLKHLPNERLTELGSMLFTRRISGARVVKLRTTQKIENYEFLHYGSHSSQSEFPYLTVAAAIGIEDEDIDIFMKKFDSIYQRLRRNENCDE